MISNQTSATTPRALPAKLPSIDDLSEAQLAELLKKGRERRQELVEAAQAARKAARGMGGDGVIGKCRAIVLANPTLSGEKLAAKVTAAGIKDKDGKAIKASTLSSVRTDQVAAIRAALKFDPAFNAKAWLAKVDSE
jgi:hypothetical protein